MASDVVIDFKAPNYVPEYARRARMLTALRADPDSIPAVMAHYSRNPVDYIEDWMMTYDPRVFPQFRPFLLWPRQKEYIAWLVKHWKERQSGLVEKSRDAGASWLNCAFAIWLWAFHGAKVGFGSRKEVLVDKMGDPDSLFEKLRMLLKNMPSEVLPNGFNMKVHCGYMKVMHPTTPAAITGEAGDNIGRGGRSTVYFKDESAFYERPLLIEASLSQNTEVQIDVSTPHGPGNIFYKKRHSGKIDVFIFDWKDDPRKDDAWYAKQKDELDPVIVAQEIDRDYGASMENMLIPKKYVDAAVGFLLPQDPSLADMEEVAGLDVADEGGDENVLIFRRGPQVLDIDAWRKGNVAQSTKKAVARMRLRRIARLQYDNIGVGAGVKGELSNEGYEEVEAYGINTGESPTGGMTDNRPNSKMFFNLKAQLWWQLRRRFERTYFHREGMREYPAADMISIPDDPILRTELSTPKYEYKGAGLIAVESKEKLARRGVGSPNRADALCLTFAPAIRKVATTFRKRKNT